MCSSSQAWIKTYPTLAMVLELILKISFSLNPPCRRLSQCAQAQRSLMPLWESPLKNLHAVGQKKKRARKHFSVKTEFCIFLMSFWKLRCILWKKILEFFICALPQISVRMEELKGWIGSLLAVAENQTQNLLACFCSVPFCMLLLGEQGTCQSSLAVFHEVPIDTVKEIQVGFAGQNIWLEFCWRWLTQNIYL